MPNARLGYNTPNTRGGYGQVNARVSSFQTGILTPQTSVVHEAGSPIGLLLALTYAAQVEDMNPATFRGDYRPNARITSY